MGVCALALAPVACSLGDFDSLGAGRDENVGGNGGRAGSAGAAGTAGSAGTAGTGGSAGNAGSGGSGGSAGGPSNENLINNGDFESAVSQWTPIGGCMTTIIEDETPRPTGTRCLLTTNRLESWMGPSLNLLGIVPAGANFRVTLWLRNVLNESSDAGLDDYPVNITQKIVCAAGGTIYNPKPAGLASTDWVELSTTFIAPECEDLQESSVYVEAAPPGATFCIDDTSLVVE